MALNLPDHLAKCGLHSTHGIGSVVTIVSILRALIVSVTLSSFMPLSSFADDNSTKLQSQLVRLKGGVVWMEVDAQKRLILASRASQQGGSNVIRRQLNREVPGGEITEVSLAPWGARAIAVVEVRTKDAHEYHCLTLAGLEPDGTIDENRTVAGQLYRSSEEFNIVAVNGSWMGDGLIVVLAKVRVKDGFQFAEEGVMLIDPCPQPPLGTTVIEWKGRYKIPRLE